MKPLVQLICALASMILMGIGLWMIAPPACFLGLGLVIWADLLLIDARQRKKNR